MNVVEYNLYYYLLLTLHSKENNKNAQFSHEKNKVEYNLGYYQLCIL